MNKNACDAMEPFLTQNVFLFSTTLAPHFFHILAQIKTEMMAVEFPLEWWCFLTNVPIVLGV